jgi:pimeloyl-ACP methyl ester carboxylesterase
MSERSIVFGANNGLVGTLALPTPSSAGTADIGFLLFNAGVVHRVGPHRINVRMARQLAALGIASVRFDLAGHGDSARLSGDHSFEEQAVVDIRSAMDAFGAAANLRRFAIFGYCSGAYYGFATALVDERVAGILMFDAYRYPTLKTRARYYLNRLRQPRVLRGLLGLMQRGAASLGRRARVLAGGDEERPVPELGRIDFIPSKGEFAKGLQTLLDRGVKIHMIYSGGEIREYNYHSQFKDTFARYGIGGRIAAEFLPNLDHVATGLADQADLMRRVIAWGRELGAMQASSDGKVLLDAQG